MDGMQSLLAVNEKIAFDFFKTRLGEELPSNWPHPKEEFLYIVSVLAHYAQTSCSSTDSWLTPTTDLREFFERFVTGEVIKGDVEMYQWAGSLVVLHAGFFREQAKKRHNVRWYDQIGQSYYENASRVAKTRPHQTLFSSLASSLPDWNRLCSDLNSKLQKDTVPPGLIKF